MAQWTMTDEANGAPYWANTNLRVALSQDGLYANTVAVGTFAVGTDEMTTANTSSEAHAVPHAGWNLRTVGTGGRAGRVHYQTLVAGSSVTGDGDGANTVPFPNT